MELELPVTAHMIKPGMRIGINASHSLNPSLVLNKIKCTPMVCDVRWVVDNGIDVLLEGVDHRMYKVKRNTALKQLARKPSYHDNLKPQSNKTPTTFNGVSIE